jgi:hypothetical protein
MESGGQPDPLYCDRKWRKNLNKKIKFLLIKQNYLRFNCNVLLYTGRQSDYNGIR